MEEISDHAKNLTLSEDLEKPLEERVNLFYSFVKVSACVHLHQAFDFSCVWVQLWFYKRSTTEQQEGTKFMGLKLTCCYLSQPRQD